MCHAKWRAIRSTLTTLQPVLVRHNVSSTRASRRLASYISLPDGYYMIDDR